MKQRTRTTGNADASAHGVESVHSDRNNKRATKKMKFQQKLLKFESLPDYMQDNEFIRDHYRCEWPLKYVVLSVFSVHNETLNIWTHLVGFAIFLCLTAVSLTEKATVENLVGRFFRPGTDGPLMMKMNKKTNGSDAFFLESYLRHIPKPSILHVNGDSDVIPKWPWFVFLGGAMCCMVCSSLAHLFACHSRRFYLFFWRLDYAGISLMIICSFFAPIYYAFSCHPYWRLFYLASITGFGSLAVVTLFAPALSSGRFRSFRANIFLAMGFSGVIPAAHAVILYWHNSPHILVALGYEIVMGFLYAAGAGFYTSRIPERWRPGAFDIVGQSHQIFHVLVVVAALAHSAATLVIMDLRGGLPACDG
ncbi:heptahelical transmembrane protein 2-like isoform X2 [Coffea arabica]|uniref:Heptahelical transmembrane protein 2-like isoform X2 n=1 Tax=Coffea arabica TaxID=13443 RepID=A0A6P6SI10_COFAR|nr:heptahelical transmembrane protein 2-like isoform X2 [Coffea arabica]